MNKERIVVAMSGGVDSAVAAALLARQGYEVIGITLCFNLKDSITKRPNCCGMQGINDAQRVAHRLGIRHYVLNMQKLLQKHVIDNFCQEYIKGRTPNPCVRCNQYIKFDALLKKAFSLGAGYLATGHYARIASPCLRGERRKTYILNKAKDRRKDQSYFLYRLNRKQLSHILFPLGNMLKLEVRKLAREFDLPVADKLASQEICFLPDSDYRAFLKKQRHLDLRPGTIVDRQGNILGNHKGIAFYTVGQRQGLGIAKGYPLYIVEIDHKNNKIIVAEKKQAYRREFLVKRLHLTYSPKKKKVAVGVKIRYNHKEAPAEVTFFKQKIKVRFGKPQFAITPGQSAVFYDKDKILGGGIIDKVLT